MGRLSSLSSAWDRDLLRLQCDDFSPPPYGDRFPQTPVAMELTFKNMAPAEAVSYLPWVKRTGGKTIMIETPTIIEVNRFLSALFTPGAMR